MTSKAIVDQRNESGQARHALLFDEDGFLIDPTLWNVEVGRMIADTRDVGPLRAEHWEVLHLLRDRYLRMGAISPLRRLCRNRALTQRRSRQHSGVVLRCGASPGCPTPGKRPKPIWAEITTLPNTVFTSLRPVLPGIFLSLSLDKFPGAVDRHLQAAEFGTTCAGYINRGAVVYRSAYDRQSQSDIDSLSETQVLEYR